MKQKSFLSILLFFLSVSVFAKSPTYSIERVEPASWWIGMNDPELQVMIYGSNISLADVELNYEGVTISKKALTDNPNYIFLYLNIDKNTKPGKFDIVFKKDKKNA